MPPEIPKSERQSTNAILYLFSDVERRRKLRNTLHSRRFARLAATNSRRRLACCVFRSFCANFVAGPGWDLNTRKIILLFAAWSFEVWSLALLWSLEFGSWSFLCFGPSRPSAH